MVGKSQAACGTSLIERVAFHEAGHAVVACVVGIECGGVSIVPASDGTKAGHTIIPTPWAILDFWWERSKIRELRSALIARVIVLMAGAEAEVECLGDQDEGDETDRRMIGYMLDELRMADREERLRGATRRLVRRHRDKIETVAALLIERKTITAAEVHVAIWSLGYESILDRAADPWDYDDDQPEL